MDAKHLSLKWVSRKNKKITWVKSFVLHDLNLRMYVPLWVYNSLENNNHLIFPRNIRETIKRCFCILANLKPQLQYTWACLIFVREFSVLRISLLHYIFVFTNYPFFKSKSTLQFLLAAYA